MYHFSKIKGIVAACVFLLAGRVSLSAQVTRVSPNGTVEKIYQYNPDGRPVDTNQLKQIQFKKDTSSRVKPLAKTSGSKMQMSMFGLDNTCYAISGPSYPEAGVYQYYDLTCLEPFYGTVYWQFSSGGCIDGYYGSGTGIYINWSNSCVGNSAHIYVYDEYFNYIADLPIYIQPQSSPLTVGAITSGNISICQGQSAGWITASAATGGFCGGNYAYQWQYSYDAVNWTNAIGNTSQQENYEAGTLSTTTYFRRRVTCNGDVGYTGYATVYVTGYPSGFSIVPQTATTVCPGSWVTVATSNGQAASWYVNGAYVSGGSSSFSTSSTGSIVAYVSNGCFTTQSDNSVTVSNIPPPGVSAISGSTAFCMGSGTQLSSSTGGGSWSSSNPSVITVNGSGYAYSGGSAGSATVYYTVYDGCGQYGQVSQTITARVNPSPSISGSSTISCGATTTLSAVDPYFNYYDAYYWYDGNSSLVSQSSAPSLGAGSYYITASRDGCTGSSGWFTVSQTPVPTATASASKTNLCNGESATLSINYSGEYHYMQWYRDGVAYSAGYGLYSIPVSSPGNYYCVVYNSYWCSTVSSSVQISTYSFAPTVSPSGSAAQCGGSIYISASSASAYEWYNGGSFTGGQGSGFSASSSGSYSVRAMDGNGCWAWSNPVSISIYEVPSTPVINQGGSVGYCTGQSGVTLSVNSAGGSVQWYQSGSPLSGYTATAYTFGAGSYSVAVSNSSGCWSQQSAATTITEYPNPTPAISGPTAICGENIQLTLTNAAYFSYITWYRTGSNGLPEIVQQGGSQLTLTPGSDPGEYYCTGVTGSGCNGGESNRMQIVISTASQPVITTPVAGYCPGGTTTLTASHGVTFQWYRNNSPIGGATQSTYVVDAEADYKVQIIDPIGCSLTSPSQYITAYPNPSSSVSAGSALAFCSGGSVTLSAEPGYSYAWSTGAGSQSITVNASGTYSVQVTNSYNCSAVSSGVAVTVYPLPSGSVTASGATSFCAGGSVNLEAPAGYSYLWNTGATTQSVTVGQSGSYSVVLTSQYGCQQTLSAPAITVHPYPSPSVQATGTQLACGQTATLGVYDPSMSSYDQYSWYNASGGVSNNASIVVGGGTYRVVGVKNGCEASSAWITIEQSAVPKTLTVAEKNNLCNGESTTISVSNAASYSTFQWYLNGEAISGATAAYHTLTQAGAYTCRATTVYGCVSESDPLTIQTYQFVPSVSSSTEPAVVCAGQSLVFTAGSASGYQWKKDGVALAGETGATLSVTASGIYQVVATNAEGCVAPSAEKPAIVNSLPATPVIESGSTDYCEGGGLPPLSVSGAGGSVKWFNHGVEIAGLHIYSGTFGEGEYTVQISNASGCWSTASTPVVITKHLPLTPAAITGATEVCEGASITLANSVSGGSWSVNNEAASIGASTGVLQGLSSGTVIVTYQTTTSAGCTAAVTTSIEVRPLPAPGTITGATGLCVGATAVLANEIAGGTWSSDNAGVATVDAAGTVSGVSSGTVTIRYTVTNSYGCVAAATRSIQVHALPVLPSITGLPVVCIAASVQQSNTVSGGHWSVSDTSLATVFQDGTLYGKKAGTVTVQYTVANAEGCQAQVGRSIDVLGTPVLPLLTAVHRYGCVGTTLLYEADAAGGTWSSSDPLIATVNQSGVVSGLKPGVTVIGYSVNNGCGISTASLLATFSAPMSTTITNAPQAAASEPVSVLPLPAVPGAVRLNYIKTRNALGPVTDTTVFRTAPATQVSEMVEYIDGLGRPLQAVSRQASPGGKDMVRPVIYDAFGRETLQYLPYTSTATEGSFRTDPFAEQAAFMATQFPGEQVYYQQTRFEAVPGGRPVQVFAPGNSWGGAGRGTQTVYRFNAAEDSVIIWSIGSQPLPYTGNNATVNIPEKTGYYPAGSLYKTQQLDEDGNSVIEYKDRAGRVILKKTITVCTAGEGHNGWNATYYIYDDFSNLRFVLPPKAVELAYGHAWNLAADTGMINELAFRYEYDDRNRMTAKKVPGVGWVYMVYDPRDRLVFTQDANMRTGNRWMASLYDAYNRAITTGLISYSGNREELAGLVTAQYAAATPTAISVSFTYAGNQPAGNSQLQYPFDPLPSGANYTALSWQYYDGYGFSGKTYQTADNNKIGSAGNAYAETLPGSASLLVNQLQTGSRTRILDDPNDLASGFWTESVYFYDEKGRQVQTASRNHSGGDDVLTTRYGFAGQVIGSYLRQQKGAGQSLRQYTSLQYDKEGRPLVISKMLDDDERTRRLIARNLYDELGQLSHKRIGQLSAEDTAALEGLQQEYNIRGWLSAINGSYARGTDNNHWFGMELAYDRGYAGKQFNGNIAGSQWRSRGDGEMRSYGFRYDRLNRLLSASFLQYTGGNWNNDAGVDFSVVMGDGIHAATAYDANGNILAMKQKGLKLNASEVIDSLQYGYYAGSNRLKYVLDAANNPHTTLGDFRSSETYLTALGGVKTGAATDYSYDGNGNMVQDLNKDIDSAGNGIEYNHLNLPWKIHVKDKGSITYLYDAAGNKLAKLTTEAGLTTRTDYIGGYIYRNDTLQQIAQEEGRIRPKDSSFVYDYFIRDHLGNTRMVLTEERQRDIYPAATLEASAVAAEGNYYHINPASIAGKPGSLATNYPNNNGIPNPGNANAEANSTEMYRLNAAAGDKMGLGIALKVMSGDTVSLLGRSYWHSDGGSVDNNYSIPVNDLLLSLANPGSVFSAKGYTYSMLQGLPVTPASLQSWLDDAPANGGNPKAYINWILLDEQMKPVPGSSGFDAVGATDELKLHTRMVQIPRNGYLYIYASNQSNQDVFFDNLQVVHARGPLLEETHYYPFGLTMAGISSKAAGKLENKKEKFQGRELDDDLGLNWYQYRYRSHDPQIGRFIQIDPLAPKYPHNSTYAFAENKVTMGIDLEGLELLPFNSAWFRSVSQNKPSGQGVQVVATNVPAVFKDASGSPLFSAGSVGVTPKGAMADKGEQLRSGNNLPRIPQYAWSLDAQPTASTSGGKVGNNLDNNQAFADKIGAAGSALQEINNWYQTFKDGGSVDIWNAYRELSTNIKSFDKATKSIGALPFGMTTTDAQRGDLINFVNDGTLPTIDVKNLQQSLQYGMQIMQSGMQVMNKNKIQVRESTNETYQLYSKLLELLNGAKQKSN